MTDPLSNSRRSENMRHIRSKGTKPEITVRKIAHSMGYRFRLHVSDLPGKPDIVFPKLRKVIFVHGCFWHLHKKCREGRIPNSRREYWEPKLFGNVERDRKQIAELRKLGWRSLVIWECETGKSSGLEKKLARFLG